MRDLIFILILTVCSSASATLLSLTDLLNIAQKSQVEWQQANSNRIKAESSRTIQRSKFFPNLGLTSNYSYDNQVSGQDTEGVSSFAAVESNWSLYDNGTGFRNYRLAQLELQKAEIDLTLAQDKATFEILSRYLQHFLVRKQKDVTERKLAMLQNQYRITERLYRQGLKTVRDYQRLQTDLERTKLTLLRFSDQFFDTFEELQRYIGAQNLSAPEQLEPLVLPKLLSFFEVKSTGVSYDLNATPEVKSAQLNDEMQKIKTVESSTSIWPQINLSARAGWGSSGFADQAEHWSPQERFFVSGVVKLSWTLFDWGGNWEKRRSAVLDKAMTELGLSQAKLNVEVIKKKEARQIERQKKSVSVTKSIFEIERKTYLNIEAEYRDGRATYLDLITSLDRQAQAEIDLEEELKNYTLVLAEILKLQGGLYASVIR